MDINQITAFLCSLADNTTPVAYRGDKSVRVTIDIPETERGNADPLRNLIGKRLGVVVFLLPEGIKGGDDLSLGLSEDDLMGLFDVDNV